LTAAGPPILGGVYGRLPAFTDWRLAPGRPAGHTWGMEQQHKDVGEFVVRAYVVILVAVGLAGLLVVLFHWG